MQMRMICNWPGRVLQTRQRRGVDIRAVFRQARQLPRREFPGATLPSMQGRRMARSGRPKASAAKVPAVNDNQPDAHGHEDDCRNELMAMPDVSALDFTAQFTVWALRSWVQAFKSKQSFDDVTHRTFARFGL